VLLTVGISPPSEGPPLTLVVRAVGGLEALVILSLGFAAGSVFVAEIGVEEDEEVSADASVGFVILGVDDPDSISSRRRRICKAYGEPLHVEQQSEESNLIHLLRIWSLWGRRGRLLIIIHNGGGIVKLMVVDNSQMGMDW